MTKKEHQGQASFHTQMSSQCEKAADLHEQLATATEGEKHSELHKDLSACHTAMGEAHASEASRHLAACKASDSELEKADGGELAEMLRDLKKFLGSTVMPMPGGISAIPRTGAPDAKAIAEARKSLDPTLRAVITDPSESQPTEIAFNAARQ